MTEDSHELIESSKLRLHRTTESDLAFVMVAEHSPANRDYVILWPERRHEEALSSLDEAHLICESALTNERVGYAIITGLTNPHRSNEFRRLVITRKNEGYGREAVCLIKQIAFRTWNAHRLWLDGKEHNHRRSTHLRESGIRGRRHATRVLDG
ncbi:GNAT family N-acetyltransferase [bacterium]|nr:GNAT family N-acetyltransferase [bacterium]